MKITIVLGAFFPVPPVMGGAVEKIWLALAREFALRGHDVTLISRAYASLPRSEIVDGVTHVRLKGFDSPRSLAWLKILDLIYSLRVRFALPPSDLIVTNTFWLPLLLLPSRAGKLYVHVARFPKGQMRLYKHAARLQTPSRDVGRTIESEVPDCAARIRVIPNPLAEQANDGSVPPIATRQKIILYVGRLHPEKGVQLLVDAFVGLSREQRTGWRLVIVGPAEAKYGGGGAAYSEQLRQAAAATDARIEFRGAIFDAAQLIEEYRRARLFVYPSLAEAGESFGLAPLEAMAQGCAVVVSKLSCFNDFIRDRENAFTFDHRAASPEIALRDRLAALLSDEASLAQVSALAQQTASEYSVDRVAEQFITDFEDVVRGKGSCAI